MGNLNMLTLLQTQLFANGLDTVVTLGSKTTIELLDANTESTVAVFVGDTLEDAYANAFGILASRARDAKTGKYEGLSRL